MMQTTTSSAQYRACAGFLRGLLFVAIAVMGACGSPNREAAVPEALEDRATVLGQPEIRTWSDQLNTPFRDELLRAVKRQLADIQAQPDPYAAAATAHFLALSGGGSDGAFGAGLLCGWTASGTRPEFTVVTGVSTGALIAPFAFLGPAYDAKLTQAYTTVRTREIMHQRFILTGLLGESLFNTDGLRRMVEQLIDEQMMRDIAVQHARGRVLVIATVNMDSDRGVIWNIGAIAASGHPGALKLIQDVLIASSAIPAAFPPVMIDVDAAGTQYQEMHVDGATKSQVFLYPPSLQLQSEAENRGVYRERVAYVIRNARLEPVWAQVTPRTLPIAVRAITSLIRANGIGDLIHIYFIAQRDEVQFNLAFIPSTFQAAPAEFFDPVYMTELFNYGFKSANVPGGYPWLRQPPGWMCPPPEYVAP